MKKYLLIVLLFAVTAALNCQQIYLETGQSISNFKFTDSEGIALGNLQPINYTYMKLGYRTNILIDKLFLSGLAIYNGYGAKGSDGALENYFAWDLTYLGLDVGVDYEFYNVHDFTFYIKGEGSVEFLLRGTQTLNGQVYNLRGEEEFDSPIYMLRAGLGAQYKISEKISVFTQYSFGGGGPFKGNEEKLRIRAHSIGIGLLINLTASEQTPTKMEDYQKEIYRQDLKETLERINKLEKESEHMKELEKEIENKDSTLNDLKDTLSDALFDLREKDLQVKLNDGKLYVTLENDMLFQSGSWKVESEGIGAVNALATVLAKNPDVNILIEGHTDDRPYSGNGNLQNNWDLSAKRASAIVEILMKNPNINPKNLTAAGRGEHAPVASNLTKEGRAKNRRIEVIITPKLDEVYKILNYK